MTYEETLLTLRDALSRFEDLDKKVGHTISVFESHPFKVQLQESIERLDKLRQDTRTKISQTRALIELMAKAETGSDVDRSNCLNYTVTLLEQILFEGAETPPQLKN